jgi:hypothetical protein
MIGLRPVAPPKELAGNGGFGSSGSGSSPFSGGFGSGNGGFGGGGGRTAPEPIPPNVQIEPPGQTKRAIKFKYIELATNMPIIYTFFIFIVNYSNIIQNLNAF